ncbi:hypothetical protein [Streptomyces sp. H39-S7]|uniref:hypothetical protein n=1 Tax=Streptomyces sp. H39-S7 TaxID=3004357 RepID=UPI0022AEB48B|nr:hypothetical protein [Streptomyces sp. H39-S7]MCZ4124134.1 hypothetical protein [Streptomyces sp. H39-S7]
MIADIPDYPITADDTSLFNSMRQGSLLCHLAASMAADVEYQLVWNVCDLPPAKRLGRSVGQLGQAIAHSTQALAPLIALTTTAQDTLQQKVDALEHHSRLRIHLDDADRALVSARTALEDPLSPTVTSAPTPAPSHALAVRRRA